MHGHNRIMLRNIPYARVIIARVSVCARVCVFVYVYAYVCVHACVFLSVWMKLEFLPLKVE